MSNNNTNLNGVDDFMSTVAARPQARAMTSGGGANAGGGSLGDYQDKFRAKRTGLSAKDRKDKEMELELENNTLKNKKNLLEKEVMKMETKLKRIDELLRSRSMAAGDNTGYDARDLQRDLQNEYDKLKEQNEFTREKVRKLNVIQRGLQSKVVVPNKVDKYAHVQGKLGLARPQTANNQYTTLAEDLRKQLVVNEREIANLQGQLNKMNIKGAGLESGMRGADQLRREIEQMYEDIRQTNNEIEKMHSNFESNERIFTESKNYTEEIQKKIREVQAQNEQLRNENMRLEQQTRDASNIESEIRQIQGERDDLERMITEIMRGPFAKQDGQSMGQRMAELEEKVRQKTITRDKLSEECRQMKDKADKAQQELNKLQGSRDHLAGEHKQATEEWKNKAARQKDNNRQPNSINTVLALHNVDPDKYNTMMDDLRANDSGSAPAWAQLEFLDRIPNAHGLMDPKQALQEEIKALQMEKSSFAQELEKAQNLLKLQTDIEKENTNYFQQEIKRLTLIEKSSSAKLEELARRADEKQKMINDLKKKMPSKNLAAFNQPGHQYGQDDDAMSEFSMITHESEIRQDENIFDFKIEQAEFFQDSMKNCNSLAEIARTAQQGLITLCTIDFYNHRTETTQMGEGLRPNYQTQFSFKNKVDDFYVSFLQRQTLKIDVYISLNNTAVHMGHAEITLRNLIERETLNSDKTPLIQDQIAVYGVGQDSNKAIGVVQFKMRLRKPIQESMRYYREKGEIQNLQSIKSNYQGPLAPKKYDITITVKGARDLQFAYSDVTDVAPFFYYQFYTFDERYSTNAAGVNPKWGDIGGPYTVTMDARAQSYFEKECLEIILFDDHAPIAGTSPDAQAGDDMIGICKVPLKELINGCGSTGEHDIIKQGSNKSAGRLEVSISCIDIASKPEGGLQSVVDQAVELQYAQDWEDDLILRIARPLAKMNVDTGLLFGVFSRGQRTCTKEDFKYTCLNKLQLNQEISQRELDMFLAGNLYFKDISYIEKDDFSKVFEHAINRARHEAIKDEALNNFAVTGTRRNLAEMTNAYEQEEVRRILHQCIQSGTIEELREAITRVGRGQIIDYHSLQDTLQKVGQVPQTDANRFCNFFDRDKDQRIPVGTVLQFMSTARNEAYDNSNAFKKFKESFNRHPKLAIARFQAQDINQDGVLDENGFQAAMLLKEFNLNRDDCTEVYQIIQQPPKGFIYRQWILDNFREHMHFFSDYNVDVSGSLSRDQRGSTMRPGSSTQNYGLVTGFDEGKAKIAMQKFEKYIRDNNTTLGVMFSVLDTNSDQKISMGEFRQKMKSMFTGLDEDECNALFRKMDGNHSGDITYAEIVEMFSDINTQQIIKRMQDIITKSDGDAEFFFNQYCRSDPKLQNMNQADFTSCVKNIYPDAKPIEIAKVYRYFDSTKDYIPKADFLRIMRSDYKSKTSQGGEDYLTVEDVIKPLRTRINRNNVNIRQLFDKYDKDHSGRLSANEIAQGILVSYKVELDPHEIQQLQEYFSNKFGKKEITLSQFQDILHFKFTNNCQSTEAKATLYDIKEACKKKGLTPKDVLNKELSYQHGDPSGHITTRRFKMAVHALGAVTNYNLGNLCKYLEYNCGQSTAQNEGFVSIDLFRSQVESAYNPSAKNFDASASMSGTFGKTKR